MVALFEGRGDILLWLGTKNVIVSAQEFLNVLPWGHAYGSIGFPDEVATKMKADWTRTFEHRLILVLQKISDSLGVLGSCSDIIHIDSYILIDIAILSHPDIQLGLAWGESHDSETISKVLMPMEARGPEAIERLEDDEGVALQLTKFRTCNDIDLFLHLGL